MINYSKSDFNLSILGSFYSKEKTIFRVYAPENKGINLVIYNKRYPMHKKSKYFEIALGGDLQFTRYCYENENGIKFRDPFAYLSEEYNSIIMDANRFKYDVIKPEPYEHPIIYELSVRDFSSDFSYSGKYKKKFLSFSEEGLLVSGESCGLDYLKELGVSHIQLMPVFDFDNDNSEYNWGYNPLCYNYVKKDYVYDENNPYAYISELRKVVNALHSKGLRVVLDVVFNHVYDHSKYDLEKMLPGHVFRKKQDGTLANGTMCGNEIQSDDPFVREYIIEMVRRYVRLFDIDGVRLDLMGILDFETVNELSFELRKIKDDFLVYGEGWNMGDVLEFERRASLFNAYKMNKIMMFNDFFRDTIAKYVCGNNLIVDDVKSALSGNCNSLAYYQSINYVECHDNITFYDRLLKYKTDDSEQVKIKRVKLALGLVMLSRGTPFIHAGQEFLRTKNLNENSYNAGDNVNRIEWSRRVQYKEVVDYFKALIKLRNRISEIHEANIYMIFKQYDDCLIYQLNDIVVFINPTENNKEYEDRHSYEMVFDDKTEGGYNLKIVKIPAYSIIVVKTM